MVLLSQLTELTVQCYSPNLQTSFLFERSLSTNDLFVPE